MWKTILIIIFVLFLVIVLFLNYVGFFSKIVIEEKEVGPYMLVYEDHKGPYKDIGPVMDKVYYSLLNEDKIETTRGMGIYYDNPQNVAQSDLRSKGGSLIEEKDLDKIANLENKYKTLKLDKQKAVVIEFPYKNKFSVMFGVVKVYPVLQKYITSKNYSQKETIEIYDKSNKKIYYMMNID